MRIRQIKPSFWSDATIARLTYPARLFYIGLWNLADDAGWLQWDPVEAAAVLFAYEHPAKRLRLVEGWAKELRDLGRLKVHACGCAEIPTMREHQHPGGQRTESALRRHLAHAAGEQTALPLEPPPAAPKPPPKAPRPRRAPLPPPPTDVPVALPDLPSVKSEEGRVKSEENPPPTPSAEGEDGTDLDVLDGYYRLTASWPKPSVAAWLERLEEAHGPDVLPALAAEWTADSDRSTLLSRTENRLKREAHLASTRAEQARKEAARRAEEEERARIAAMPPEQREANMARLRAMLEGSGIVKPMPGGTKP